MTAWMGYVTAMGCVLGLTGCLAERGLRHLDRPGRHVWAGLLAVTALIGLAGPLSWLIVQREATATSLWILAVWAVVSGVMLTSLRISAWTLRRNERGWRHRRVEGHGVLISSGCGPGVMGGWRPRIVLPAWVLEADTGLRRLIVRHEAEHVRTGDAWLFHVLLGLVSLVPWCLPLWWQLHRAREAIEADCDARVLSSASRREYAEALVVVAGRPMEPLAASLALAPSVKELERRIRLVTAGAADRSSRAGWRYLGAALVMVLGLAAVPIPTFERPDRTPQVHSPVVEPDRRATLIFSIPAGPLSERSEPR